MGCEASLPIADVVLVPQAQPVAAVDRRFCEPRVVTLYEGVQTIGRHSILDAHSGATRFETEKRIAKWIFLSRRQWLLDANKDPIANFDIKSSSTSKQPIVYVHAGDDHEDKEELFQIFADRRLGDKTVVQVKFNDVVTRQRCEIGFEGDWYRRTAFFWLDRGCQGVREPVARIYRPCGDEYRHYQVDIAPNMDTAFIALICAILGGEC